MSNEEKKNEGMFKRHKYKFFIVGLVSFFAMVIIIIGNNVFFNYFFPSFHNSFIQMGMTALVGSIVIIQIAQRMGNYFIQNHDL